MAEVVNQQAGNQLPHPDRIQRAVMALRWLALVVVFDLSFFDLSTEGVWVPPLHLVLIVGAYDLLILLLRDHLRSRERVLNLIALDVVIATLAVYLTGGVHSSFFILYSCVILSAALYMNLMPSILVTLFVALLYILTCSANPAGIWSPVNLNILATKLTLLMVIGFVAAVLLEGLRREHFESEREAVLAARLATLNDLLQELTGSLDLDRVLEMIVRAARHLLESDVALITLLEDDHRHIHIAAAEGMHARHLPDEHWDADDERTRTLLGRDDPFLLQEAGRLPAPMQHLVQTEGIASAMSVPLALDHVRIGMLSVGQRTPRTFTPEEAALLKPLAQEAALAIRNAHLYEGEKRQVEQLQTLERLQQNFVSYVSHELRTPLTSIKTSVALLQETQNSVATSVQKELIQTIDHNTGRLESMVSDLLQMTQLEAGSFALALQPTDVRAIVERAIRSVHPLFDAKDQTIEFRMPEQMEPVVADRRRLEQVLVNLLSNAHKYTPRGAVARVELLDRPDEVEFCVSDNGPGIPRSEQERIFDKFYVGAKAKSGTGVGLGLYITRQLVELFGGRIWVESEPGGGSTFRFTLPKKELTDEDPDCR